MNQIHRPIRCAQWMRLLCMFLCMIALTSCGKSAEQQAIDRIEPALTKLFVFPNTAYRDLFERMRQDPANFQEDGPIRTMTSQAEAEYQQELMKLYGDYFTEACFDRLQSSGTLGLDDLIRPADFTAEVKSVTVQPQADQKNYDFTITLSYTKDSESVEGKITGTAQCLPEDHGKISFLQWSPDSTGKAVLNP